MHCVSIGTCGSMQTPNARAKDGDLTNLAIVDAHDGANHFRHNNHISEMGLDDCRLLVWHCLLLCLSKLLNETHGLAAESSLKAATCAGVNEVHELFIAQIEKIVELRTHPRQHKPKSPSTRPDLESI